jgi:hypothetical protein
MSLLSICTEWEKRLNKRRKKTLTKQASKLKELLTNSKFHSHLASWRVVISTPDNSLTSFLFFQQKNIGMDGPLVDSEGFPRADIDVYSVRHARHQIACKCCACFGCFSFRLGCVMLPYICKKLIL